MNVFAEGRIPQRQPSGPFVHFVHKGKGEAPKAKNKSEKEYSSLSVSNSPSNQATRTHAWKKRKDFPLGLIPQTTKYLIDMNLIVHTFVASGLAVPIASISDLQAGLGITSNPLGNVNL